MSIFNVLFYVGASKRAAIFTRLFAGRVVMPSFYTLVAIYTGIPVSPRDRH
jgi:hypothetical protein